MALKQNLSQKLDQRLSPQQIQLMKLLQVPTSELEQRIQQEIEENPALAEAEDPADEVDPAEAQENEDSDDEFDLSDYFDDDIADYKTYANNQSKDDEERVIPIAGEESFQDKLMEQLSLNNLTPSQIIIAEVLVGNLDESGYLSRPLEAVVDDLAFHFNLNVTEQDIETVLFNIQELDPAGIGARNLQECLVLQSTRRQDGSVNKRIALEILRSHFDAFTRKHYDKISRKLDIDASQLKAAIDEILKLNPKPGGASKSTGKNLQQIVPDFILTETDGLIELSLNARNAPELKISKEYETLLRSYAEGAKTSKSDKQALVFVKHKLESAKWFIDAIAQRQQTLLLTMNAILNYQHAFFLTGDETKMKPMILKDIAERVNMDISTISRVANSKFVQTNHGVYPLKFFFSESLSTDSGEEVSTREVKKILMDAISAEDKSNPLPDEKLMALLNEKGYNIARRTVAKYREQLNLPVARLRKEL